MDKELFDKKVQEIRKMLLSPDIPIIQQIGDKNINVNNSNGGTVNLTIVNSQNHHSSVDNEAMKVIQSLSREYYHLIVTCDKDIFSTNEVEVSSSRALIVKKGVPIEMFEKCFALSNEGNTVLKHIPAIICTENRDYRGVTTPDQFAIFAYIEEIVNKGKNYIIKFHPINLIQQVLLCSKNNAHFFDIDIDCAITDLNRSAWSVHKVNVFDAFDKAKIPMYW